MLWRRWIEAAILSGALKAPGYAKDPEPYFDVEWRTPRWAWVDPLKDIQANREAIAQRVRSISSVIRETGNDPDDVFDEIQKERMKMEEMGIEPEHLTASAAQTEQDNGTQTAE